MCVELADEIIADLRDRFLPRQEETAADLATHDCIVDKLVVAGAE
jgi:hypothetical protein